MPATMMAGMQVRQFILNITSERPQVLHRFYRDVLALPEDVDYPLAVRAGGGVIMFGSHSEVRGGAREPQRYLINLQVEDIALEQGRIEAQGVSFVRRKGREHWGGIISTLLDPDGNYVQLIEFRPEGMA